MVLAANSESFGFKQGRPKCNEGEEENLYHLKQVQRRKCS